MSRRKNALLAGGILVAAVVIAVLLVRMRPQPPQAPAASNLPMVGTVESVEVDGPLTVLGSGTVRPRAEIELAPQVGGRVAWVSPSLVSGGRVRSGEPLLRIEEADYRNAVQQARAQVAQDEVAVLQAEEEARIARTEYRQFLQRRAEDGVAGDPVADSAAQASGLVFREPQMEAARASLERARAQLADAELALARTTLTAPFDGVVRAETVDEGAFRSAGQTVATLFASDAVEVVVPLADEQATLLPGLWALRAEDRRDALPARAVATFGRDRYAWNGYVHRVEASLDEQSRTVDVVVRIPEPFRSGEPVDSSTVEDAPPLLVGQFVDVEIQGREGRWVRLPRRALRTGNEVWAVEDGTIRIVPVRVAQRADGSVFVTGDLAGGTPVVTEGVDVVTQGMKVRLREEAGTGAATAGAADPAGTGDGATADRSGPATTTAGGSP